MSTPSCSSSDTSSRGWPGPSSSAPWTRRRLSPPTIAGARVRHHSSARSCSTRAALSDGPPSHTTIPTPSAASDASAATRSTVPCPWARTSTTRSEEHTSELQSLMRIPYAVFCLKKKKTTNKQKKYNKNFERKINKYETYSNQKIKNVQAEEEQ